MKFWFQKHHVHLLSQGLTGLIGAQGPEGRQGPLVRKRPHDLSEDFVGRWSTFNFFLWFIRAPPEKTVNKGQVVLLETEVQLDPWACRDQRASRLVRKSLRFPDG